MQTEYKRLSLILLYPIKMTPLPNKDDTDIWTVNQQLIKKTRKKIIVKSVD